MRAVVTWFIERPDNDRLFPGVMFDEAGGTWSVVITRDPKGDEHVSFLMPYEAYRPDWEGPPTLVPGLCFDVFMGSAKTCRVEILGP